MSANQIARTIGLEIAHADLLKESEAENLGKVYRAIQSRGISCIAPTTELLTVAFDDALTQTPVPRELDKYMTEYINSVAAPAEEAAKSKRKVYCITAAAIVVIAVILIAALASGGNNDTIVDEDNTTGTVTSTDTERTDTENEATDSTEDTEDDVTAGTLDASLTYYADIEVQDYGTITV